MKATRSWRRLWHLCGGLAIPLLSIPLSREILLIFLGILTAIVLMAEVIRLSSPALNRWLAEHLRTVLKSQEKFRFTGTTYLLLASLAVFFFFEKYVAITSLFFLATGDLAAAVIGEKYGKKRIFRKSLEGSLACLGMCLVIAVIVSVVAGKITLLATLAGALAATIIEMLPLPIDDNLTLPLGSAAVMQLALFCW